MDNYNTFVTRLFMQSWPHFFSTEDSIKNDIYKTIYKHTALILHKNTHFNFILSSY